MSKYLDPLLKIMIVLMVFISIMRIRYIWILSRIENKENKLSFRDREGDISIIIILLLILNRSIFDRFKYSYQPLLRYFHIIIIIMFIVYCILQLTQFIIFTGDTLFAPQDTVNINNISKYKMKKNLYGYKFIIYYNKNNKERNLSFIASRKKKDDIKAVFERANVNIV